MPNAARKDSVLRTLAHLLAAQARAKTKASKRANQSTYIYKLCDMPVR
jgi:hypothetical protein